MCFVGVSFCSVVFFVLADFVCDGLVVLVSFGLVVLMKQIKERVGDSKAFLTFDIDFVDPAYAPGTGTIEVGGWTGPETLDLVRSLKGINFVGYDLVEVMPYADPSQITAFLAGNIMFEFISLIALRKKERR